MAVLPPPAANGCGLRPAAGPATASGHGLCGLAPIRLTGRRDEPAADRKTGSLAHRASRAPHSSNWLRDPGRRRRDSVFARYPGTHRTAAAFRGSDQRGTSVHDGNARRWHRCSGQLTIRGVPGSPRIVRNSAELIPIRGSVARAQLELFSTIAAVASVLWSSSGDLTASTVWPPPFAVALRVDVLSPRSPKPSTWDPRPRSFESLRIVRLPAQPWERSRSPSP